MVELFHLPSGRPHLTRPWNGSLRFRHSWQNGDGLLSALCEAVSVLHWSAIIVADIHILFVTPLPASNPVDKSRFTRWLDWYDTPDYQKTFLRERRSASSSCDQVNDPSRIGSQPHPEVGKKPSPGVYPGLPKWTFALKGRDAIRCASSRIVQEFEKIM